MSLSRLAKFERFFDRVVPASILVLGLMVTAAIATVSL